MKCYQSSSFLYGANVRANGIRQHYMRFGGEGSPLVIVPGITSPAANWAFVAERLGRTHDVYVLDVRGRGLSEAGDQLDYRISACAADVVAFLETIRLPDCILMGHSYGARICLRATTIASSGFVDRLVMIDPPVSGPGRRRYPSEINWYIDGIRRAAGGMEANEMHKDLPGWSLEQLQVRAEWLHTCNETAVIASYRDMHDDDMFADLPQISIPTLVVAAGKGGVIQSGDIETIRTSSRNAEVVIVESAGHMIPWDDEEVFFSVVLPFIL